MKMLRTTFASIAFSFILGTTAQAAELFTADVAVTGNRDFDCRITNVSGAPVLARIRIVNAASGAIVADSRSFTLGAQRGGNTRVLNPNLALFCHFSVEGLARNARAIGCVEAATLLPRASSL